MKKIDLEVDSTGMICEDYKAKLNRLEEELKELRFESFGSEDAMEIGLFLMRKGKEATLPMTIDIRKTEQQLFHYAFPGTTGSNDQWVVRKNRVALHFKKSSYYISQFLKSLGVTIEDYYKLCSEEYAPYGGAFPILDMSGDLLGTITVSGLPDYKDHEVVVEAIRWYLNTKKVQSAN